jgi:hypothetical protein
MHGQTFAVVGVGHSACASHGTIYDAAHAALRPIPLADELATAGL